MSQIKKEIKIIKERIFSLLILSLLFVMLFTSLNVGFAANQATTNLAANIVAGTLDVTAPASLGWNNTTSGQATNQLNNVNNIKVTDYRGAVNDTWALTATANNLAAGTNILNTFARVKVSPGNITNLNSSDITGVTAGSANQALGSNSANAINMMSASNNNGAGAYQLDNTLMNLTVGVSDVVGNYTAVMTLTIQ